MVENIQNQVTIGMNEDAARLVVVVGNENKRVMGEHLVSPMVEGRFSIE